LDRLEGQPGFGQAGDGDRLAPARVPALLAPDVYGRPPKRSCRYPPSDSADERLLGEFRDWYNQDRVHLALCKDAPDHRAMEPPELGKVVVLPRLGGLHHRYSRRAA
jgi:hypothetical protein